VNNVDDLQVQALELSDCQNEEIIIVEIFTLV
jgi:hypothetical protein